MILLIKLYLKLLLQPLILPKYSELDVTIGMNAQSTITGEMLQSSEEGVEPFLVTFEMSEPRSDLVDVVDNTIITDVTENQEVKGADVIERVTSREIF